MKILDSILNVLAWRGVRKELVEITNDMKKGVMPNVITVLRTYCLCFDYRIKESKYDVGPGQFKIYLYGVLGKEIREVAWLLSKIYPKLRIYDICGKDTDQVLYSYELVVSHPEGYSFIDLYSDEI